MVRILERVDRQKAVLVGVILAVTLAMSILSANFFKIDNFVNILLQIAPLIIVASAANLLMITGNFDLSVGSVFAFCAIMHAYLTKNVLPIGWSILSCCIFALLWGASNGIMVGVLNVNPFIATMGSMYAARGFAYLIARWDGGANISAGVSPGFSDFGRTKGFGGFSIIILFLIIVGGIFFF